MTAILEGKKKKKKDQSRDPQCIQQYDLSSRRLPGQSYGSLKKVLWHSQQDHVTRE